MMRTGRWSSMATGLVLPVSLAVGASTACGARSGNSHCGPPLVSLQVKDHTYASRGCGGSYGWLGSVTVELGSTFTARVPETGDPLPVSADDSVVETVSRSGREERFRAIAPGSTTIDVWSVLCYRAPVVKSTRGIAPTPLQHPPVARCSLLQVRVTDTR
jgi:hypothetical protein